MPTELNAWSLLTTTAGLLAFLVSLYALVGRERKSPYLINSIFSVFIICIIGAIFDIASMFISNQFSLYLFEVKKASLLKIGLAFLLIAFVVAAWKIWTVSIRLSQFIAPGGLRSRIKHFAFSRWIKRQKRRIGGNKHSYSHDPLTIDDKLKGEIENIIREHGSIVQTNKDEKKKFFEIRSDTETHSLALACRHQGQSNQVTAQLAVEFLKNENVVQYMTSSRHPIEFILYLKSEWEKKSGKSWAIVKNRIVVVDAFTTHFGFLDSIHDKRTEQLVSEFGVEYIKSPPTFAGLHTAASEAFKLIGKKEPGGVRKPALVVYEDSFALADLESIEQYRIFVRHVLPSERLWDAMFTVFVETVQPETEWGLVSSYASMMLDMRDHWPATQNAA
jgi:hypothetical protein